MTEKQKTKYLVNAFSLNMLPLVVGGEVTIKVKRLTTNEFCEELRSGFISAIGHESTAFLISQLCNVPVSVNRQQIKIGDGEEALVMTVAIRLPEGKVLSQQKLEQYLRAEQIAFWKVEVL